MFKLLFVLLVSSVAPAANALAPSTLPTVSVDDFTVGRAWIWDYIESSGLVYSTERYEVIRRVGSNVLIEMSSDYGGSQNLKAHTRIDVDIAECLRAYHSRVRKQPWSLTLFSLTEGPTGSEWIPYRFSKTLAFEEKFNCNPHVYSDRFDNYRTVFDTIDGEAVFEHLLWRRLPGSKFSLSGRNRGVVFRKSFQSDPNRPYEMKRRP